MVSSLLASASASNVKVWDLLSTSGTKTNGKPSLTGSDQLHGDELSSFAPAATVTNAVRWNHDSIL
jgi:hypothetical protein